MRFDRGFGWLLIVCSLDLRRLGDRGPRVGDSSWCLNITSDGGFGCDMNLLGVPSLIDSPSGKPSYSRWRAMVSSCTGTTVVPVSSPARTYSSSELSSLCEPSNACLRKSRLLLYALRSSTEDLICLGAVRKPGSSTANSLRPAGVVSSILLSPMMEDLESRSMRVLTLSGVGGYIESLNIGPARLVGLGCGPLIFLLRNCGWDLLNSATGSDASGRAAVAERASAKDW